MGVYIWETETADSVITMLRTWNHQVHLWLKFYVQNRIVASGQRATTAQTMLVFGVSALWHGLYPGYYIMFFLAALLMEVSKDVFRARVLFNRFIPSFARSFIAHILTILTMNYCGIIINALTLNRIALFFRLTYGIPFAGVVLLLIYCRATNIAGRAKKYEAKLSATKKE